MENTSSKVMRPVLVKKGVVLPDTVVPMTNTEVLDIQNKRIRNFTPQSEMRIFQYSNFALTTTASISGFVINSIFRKNFRLGGLKLGLTYGTSVLLPSAFAFGIHELVTKPKILMGMESCPTCLSVKSGVFQSLIGLAYPYLLSLLTCLATSREFYTLDIAASKTGMSYLRLFRHVSPSPNILVAIGLLNMLVGMEVCRQEMQTYIKHLSKPPSEYGDTLNE